MHRSNLKCTGSCRYVHPITKETLFRRTDIFTIRIPNIAFKQSKKSGNFIWIIQRVCGKFNIWKC